MLNTWWFSKITGFLSEASGAVHTAETILSKLTDIANSLTTVGPDGSPGSSEKLELPSIVKIKDAIYFHMTKNTLARKMGETGLIAETDAHTMIEGDLKIAAKMSDEELKSAAAEMGALTNGETPKAGGFLANVANWILKNGPQFASTLVTMFQAFLPLIAAFSAAGL